MDASAKANSSAADGPRVLTRAERRRGRVRRAAAVGMWACAAACVLSVVGWWVSARWIVLAHFDDGWLGVGSGAAGVGRSRSDFPSVADLQGVLLRPGDWRLEIVPQYRYRVEWWPPAGYESQGGGSESVYMCLWATGVMSFGGAVGFHWLRKRTCRARREMCPNCGYSLTGLRAGVCPECGGAVGA